MKPLEYALFLIPFVVGYSTSALCTVGKKAGKTVDFRPPSWVFGVVWPILFGMLGVSWILAYRKDPSLLTLALYGLTSFFLGLWTVVYGCLGNKKAASWVLVLSIASVISNLVIGTQSSRLLLCPLLAWIVFATLMNTTEVSG
jgi:benzodiazapine receptor